MCPILELRCGVFDSYQIMLEMLKVFFLKIDNKLYRKQEEMIDQKLKKSSHMIYFTQDMHPVFQQSTFIF